MQIAVVKLPNLREYLILFNPSLLLSYKVQISLMPNAPGPCWGLRPQTPTTACSLRSLRSCFGRVGSPKAPPPPPKKKPGYVPEVDDTN